VSGAEVTDRFDRGSRESEIVVSFPPPAPEPTEEGE